MKICCVGITTQDRIFTLDHLPSEEGKFFASNFTEQGGGPAATAAVACARLGSETAMIARVGDDATGLAIMAELEREHVSTHDMVVIKGAISTQAAIMVDQHGQRIIISYPSPSLIPDAAKVASVDFASCDAVLADVRWYEGALEALKQARAVGVDSVLDADITDRDITELVALAAHAVFSEPGLKRFTGIEDINEALRAAAAKTSGRVYVTLGAHGYNWIDENGEIQHADGFKVNVVDTTGAGDVFHGAFAVALCLFRDGSGKLDTRAALKFAAATAALKCTKAGGRSGIPNRTEVEEYCRTH